jgi:hypothetical protein
MLLSTSIQLTRKTLLAQPSAKPVSPYTTIVLLKIFLRSRARNGRVKEETKGTDRSGGFKIESPQK